MYLIISHEPIVVQPIVVQPIVVQPIVVQPIVIQPIVVQPIVVQSIVVQPIVVQPIVVQPQKIIVYRPSVNHSSLKFKADFFELLRLNFSMKCFQTLIKLISHNLRIILKG